MKCTRFYTGEDNRTHFEDLEIPVHDSGNGAYSDLIDVGGMLIRESDGTAHVLNLHTAPRRQIIICMQGVMEIETGTGEKRRFGPGEAYLADDLTGEGHIHREIEGPLIHAWAFLSEHMDLKAWGSKAG